MEKLFARRIVAATILLFAFFVLIVVPVSADDEEVVTARVTPEQISVTISPTTTIGYGTRPLGTANIPPSSPSTDPVLDAVNTGTVNETFYMKGADATAGSSVWTLESTQGQNQYVHKFGEGGSPTYVPLSKIATDNLLGTSPVTPNSIRSFRLRLSMPTSITGVYSEYTTTVTVVATAATP